MSATEELRRLLDERGVEWDYGITGSTTTRFSVNGIDLTFTPMRDGLVCSTILTPEQAIAATLGADARPTKAESSGTLTAEKVRELIEENSRQYPSPTDPYVWLTEYDWQVIADELNATLGRRTCYVMTISEFNGEGTDYYDICSNCGYEFFDDDPLNYCPNCGRRIEVDDG